MPSLVAPNGVNFRCDGPNRFGPDRRLVLYRLNGF
jgi:hypothetical protein